MAKDWIKINAINESRLMRKYSQRYGAEIPDILSRMREAYQLFHDYGDSTHNILEKALAAAGVPVNGGITYRELSRASKIPAYRVAALEKTLRKEPERFRPKEEQLDLL